MRELVSLLGLVGVAYVAVVLLAYALQGRLLYFPSAVMEGTPHDVGLDYEEITFAAPDGPRLHGWWIPAAEARQDLVRAFLHRRVEAELVDGLESRRHSRE